jgi:hypothetical protein
MSENPTLVTLLEGASSEDDKANLKKILRVSTLSNSLNSAFTQITKTGPVTNTIQQPAHQPAHQPEQETQQQMEAQKQQEITQVQASAEADSAADNSLNDILLNVCCLSDPKDCTCFPDPADAGIHEHLRQERNRLLELEMQNYLKDGGERDHDACLFQGFSPENNKPLFTTRVLEKKKDTPRPK